MSNKFLKGILKEVKKYNKAVDDYTKIGKIPAIPYRAFVNLADYLFLTGCIEQSEALLNNAVNFVTQSSDAFINLGVLKQSTGDLVKAIEYYKKALKKDKKNTKALCLWGNCLSLQNNIEDAIKKYQKAIDIDETTAEAYLCWGIILLKKHEYTQAREKFKLAVEHNMKDARGLFMLASVEIELGLYDEALDKLMFIIDSTENNFSAYHNIAYIYFKKKIYDKTIIFSKAAIEMAPFKIESYLLLGDTYSILKQERDALSAYEKAEENNLKSLFLYLSWGSTFQKMKQFDKAIDKFKQGLETSSEETNDELYSRLARCYFEIGNIEEARINALKSIEISKENYMANEVLSDILINEKNFEEALNILEICLKNTETKALTFLKQARCYKELGNFEASNKNYEKAIEYDRDNKISLFEYIDFLNFQGDYETALKKLITLEKISNDELEVLSLVFKVNYNIAKGNLYGYNGMKAIKVAEKIKEKYPESFNFEDEYKELTRVSRE